MTTPRGWSSQEKDDRFKQEYATINPISEKRYGLDVQAHFYHTRITANIALDGVITNDSNQVIGLNIDSHGFRKGDLVYFRSGLSDGRQIKVDSVIDANNFHLSETLTALLPIATDLVDHYRPVQPRVSADGDLIVQPGATSFILDSVETKVTEDTVTPANNRPLPVKLLGVTGDINITANDLNVQLDHTGATPDSIQVGDGSKILKISQQASADSLSVVLSTEQEALIDGIEGLLTTIDADTGSIDAKLPATLGSKADAASLSVTFATEDKALLDGLEGSLTALEGQLPATLGEKADSASLAVTLSTENVALIDGIEGILTTIDADTGSIDAKLPATLGEKADTASLAVTLSTENIALIDGIEGSLSSLDGKLPATLGEKADTASLAVTLSTENLALIDGIEGILTTIDADTGNIDTKLPATIGQKANAASLAVALSTEQEVKLDNIISNIQALGSLDVLDLLDTPLIDLASTPIPASSGGFLEIVASLAANIKKIQIVEDIGEFIGIYTGAAASEALRAVLPLGGGFVEVQFAASERVTLRAMKNVAINSGNMAINFLG